ncbi:MAG TPA: hypothetical protein VF741_00535, partial [Candidatus Aquilonibacter sp.]
MHAQVGESLLQLWDGSGARSLVVVGTGKNVGKTVTLRAIYRACTQRDLVCGLTSIGRDGEAVDIVDAQAKPRIWLESQTIVATARDVLPRSPASEVLALTHHATAAGPLAYVRVRTATHYELVGPPSASALRAVAQDLLALTPRILIDGAIDRIAALAGAHDAIVVACGAAAARTVDEAIDDVRALVVRLQTPRFEGGIEPLRINGALTPALTARLIGARDRRAIVVRDPTQIVLTGKAALHAFDALAIRCERPLHVIAATVASIGRERTFDPHAFARKVARATGLPTFD